MQIGRRVFYDLTTGNGIFETGEMQGDVIALTPDQQMTVYPALSGRTLTDTGYIDLIYGDATFQLDYTTFHVDSSTKAITVYSKLTISVDKTSITANGTDTATVTASGVGTDVVTFSVNGGAGINVTPVNGTATFGFNTQVKGTYDITATTTHYGTGRITVQGV